MNSVFATALLRCALRGSIKKEVLEKEISQLKDV